MPHCVPFLLGLVVVLAGCGGAAAPASSSAAKPSSSVSPAAKPAASGPGTHVIVSSGQVSGSDIALWLAMDTGIFQKHGLDVEQRLVTGGINSLAALVSGDVQVGSQGGSETLSAAVGGADLAIVGTQVATYQFKFYVQPNIKTIQDLKGQKVDIRNAGSTVDIATRVGLKKVGLDPDKDVSYVATGSLATGIAALLGGAVAGGMATVADESKLQEKGLHPLFDMAQLKIPFASNSTTVYRGYMQAHRDVVQGYVDGLVQGIALARKDRAQSLAVMKKHFKSDDDALMGATYDFYIGEEVIPQLPYPKPEQFTDAIELLSKTNEKVRSYDLAKLLDPSFVQSAADRGLQNS